MLDRVVAIRRAAGLVSAATLVAGCADTLRVSVPPAPVEGSGSSYYAAVSQDGRYVAFESDAPNLVPGDTNARTDVFRYDRVKQAIIRVSVADDGSPATDGTLPSISADGNRVAFASSDPSLVSGDANGAQDVFVRDVSAKTTRLASVDAGGGQATEFSTDPSISPNGRYVSFETAALLAGVADGNGTYDVYVRDLDAAGSILASCSGSCAKAGSGPSRDSDVADTGAVAFESSAANFPGAGNGLQVYTRASGSLVLNSTGATAPDSASFDGRISADGTRVAFASNATNIVGADTNAATDVFTAPAAGGKPDRVSVKGAGTPVSGPSGAPDISGDGRYVSFHSDAADLVTGDGNAATDAFVRDRTAATTVRASVSSESAQGNAWSRGTSISKDGMTVAFQSAATNLVGGDGNNHADVFARDTDTSRTDRVSKTAGGSEASDASSSPSASADGRYVAFASNALNLAGGDTNEAMDVFLRDNQTGTTTLVSRTAAGIPGNRGSTHPAVSGDGRYVAFGSAAGDLMLGDTNNLPDVFVYNCQTGAMERVNIPAGGGQATGGGSGNPQISADGRYVVYESSATNLVAGDTNGSSDVFIRDRTAGTTARVSLTSGGLQATGSSSTADVSDNGRYVVFHSTAANLVAGDTNGTTDVFIRDRTAATTTRASVSTGGTQANGLSGSPRITGDGSRVVFVSDASNLVSSDTNGKRDVFVRLPGSPTTIRASIATGAGEADNSSIAATISDNARFVAFDSAASNLASGDDNGAMDVFLRDLQLGRTTRISTDALGTPGNLASDSADISADGNFAAFRSYATNLDLRKADTNGFADVYLRFTTEPAPTSVAPAGAARGAAVGVTIHGQGFRPGDQVAVADGGVTVTNLVVVDDSTITATFTISPTATTGARRVGVSRNPGGWYTGLAAAGSCNGCFTIS